MKLCSYDQQSFYTWTRTLRTLFVYTEFTKNKVSEQLIAIAAISLVRRRQGRQKVSIPDT